MVFNPVTNMGKKFETQCTAQTSELPHLGMRELSIYAPLYITLSLAEAALGEQRLIPWHFQPAMNICKQSRDEQLEETIRKGRQVLVL